jgi:hypothetical protein
MKTPPLKPLMPAPAIFPPDPDLPRSRHQSLKALLALSAPLKPPRTTAPVAPAPKSAAPSSASKVRQLRMSTISGRR